MLNYGAMYNLWSQGRRFGITITKPNILAAITHGNVRLYKLSRYLL